MRLFFLFVFLYHTDCLQAQQVDLSTINIDNDGYNEARIIGQDDDGFFVLQSNLSLDSQRNRIGFKTRKLKISYFDGMLTPKWSLPATSTQENGTVDQVVYAYDNLLFISSVESKSEPIQEAWIQKINNNGIGSSPALKVASFSFSRSSDLEKLKFIYSSTQRFAMVLLKENTDDGNQILHLALLDSAFNKIYIRNFPIPYTQKEFSFEDYKLTDEGDLAILGFFNKKDRDENGNKIKISEYHLFCFPANKEKIQDIPVKDGDKLLTQAGLVVDNQRNLAVIMGFYSDKKAQTGAGIFYATANFKENASLNVKTHSLDGGQKQKIVGERNNNNSNGITSYPIQKIILRNDGGAVIIAESAYTSEYSYYDYFTQSLIRHVEYHYDNVIIVSVNNDCSVDWSAVIPKRQESTDDGGIFSSFCPLINSDEIIIFYNKDIERNPSSFAGIISNRGDQKDLEIAKTNDHLLFLPTWGKQISENEAIIPVIQKKKLLLSKISF